MIDLVAKVDIAPSLLVPATKAIWSHKCEKDSASNKILVAATSKIIIVSQQFVTQQLVTYTFHCNIPSISQPFPGCNQMTFWWQNLKSCMQLNCKAPLGFKQLTNADLQWKNGKQTIWAQTESCWCNLCWDTPHAWMWPPLYHHHKTRFQSFPHFDSTLAGQREEISMCCRQKLHKNM